MKNKGFITIYVLIIILISSIYINAIYREINLNTDILKDLEINYDLRKKCEVDIYNMFYNKENFIDKYGYILNKYIDKKTLQINKKILNYNTIIRTEEYKDKKYVLINGKDKKSGIEFEVYGPILIDIFNEENGMFIISEKENKDKYYNYIENINQNITEKVAKYIGVYITDTISGDKEHSLSEYISKKENIIIIKNNEDLKKILKVEDIKEYKGILYLENIDFIIDAPFIFNGIFIINNTNLIINDEIQINGYMICDREILDNNLYFRRNNNYINRYIKYLKNIIDLEVEVLKIF